MISIILNYTIVVIAIIIFIIQDIVGFSVHQIITAIKSLIFVKDI